MDQLPLEIFVPLSVIETMPIYVRRAEASKAYYEQRENGREPMNQRQYILERLRTIKPVLQQEFPLSRMALFGSWARDEQTETSDVDILVDVDPSIGLRFVSLAERLESLLELQVHLVSSRAVKPNLLKRIEAELIDV